MKLKNAHWCPVVAPGPGKVFQPNYFPPEDRFYTPQEIRPAEDALSVSGACPLLDGTASDALKAKLGWAKPPSAQLLTTQLDWLNEEVYT